MSARPARAKVFVPKQWTHSIQSALVQVIPLVHYALLCTRSWAANSSTARVRQADRLEQEIALSPKIGIQTLARGDGSDNRGYVQQTSKPTCVLWRSTDFLSERRPDVQRNNRWTSTSLLRERILRAAAL